MKVWRSAAEIKHKLRRPIFYCLSHQICIKFSLFSKLVVEHWGSGASIHASILPCQRGSKRKWKNSLNRKRKDSWESLPGPSSIYSEWMVDNCPCKRLFSYPQNRDRLVQHHKMAVCTPLQFRRISFDGKLPSTIVQVNRYQHVVELRSNACRFCGNFITLGI